MSQPPFQDCRASHEAERLAAGPEARGHKQLYRTELDQPRATG
ncbi:hypothetical protein AB0C76_35290 [Kitasatospora sp. NPDC048722]